MLRSYVSIQEYYKITHNCAAEMEEHYLVDASDAVDVLTFHRIAAHGGLDKLTPFQQGRIKLVVCKLAEFISENADVINSPISGYSINGVSVQYGGSRSVLMTDGIMIPGALYRDLVSTGLCDRRL